MVARSRLALALVAVGLVAAPTASAASSLLIDGLAATAAQPIREKGSVSIPFNVILTADGFGCPAPSAFPPVTLAAAGAPPGTTLTLEPAELVFTAGQGLYVTEPTGQIPVAQPYNETMAATLKVENANVSANANLSIKITATFPGGAPPDCQANEQPPAQTAEGTTVVQLIAPPPPAPPEPVVEDKSFLPAPGFGLALLAVGALALVAARRKR